ncbi:hypothetical protein [Nonomuraea sp. NPDC049504]|uniref:hypothetical protein n=1 Tax=Nonomuraea sp. NPDC049504 TaxID=3154729 RepID=UPI0034456872
MPIEVWQQPNGYWRWAYREGQTHLLSNSEYTSEQAARRSAGVAYPNPCVAHDERPSRADRLLSGALMRFLLAVITYRLLRRTIDRFRRERLPRGDGRAR